MLQRGSMVQTIQQMDSERMKQVAMELDETIMNGDVRNALKLLHEDCEIEMFGFRLEGREAAERWLRWLLDELQEIEFNPIIIMVKGNSLFEEFALKAKLQNGERIVTREAVVLSFKEEKVASLRLYMDRLEIAEHLKSRLIRFIVGVIEHLSTRGLEN